MQLILRSVAKGAATWLPVLSHFTNSRTGGTVSARYCYSVWMRHLCVVAENMGVFRPCCVAELGPGDSLGIGLTAMLCGADQYFALDRKPFAKSENNIAIFDELLELIRDRAAIPDDIEFPGVYPKLQNYAFPYKVLDDEWVARCLQSWRVESIRRLMAGSIQQCNGMEVRYFAPWDDLAAILPESVDWIFSQAVLEHIDNLERTYGSLNNWLRPGGLMSHAIDYTCHGLTRDWNGHWTVGDKLWSIVRGKRSYLINRCPHSTHKNIIKASGFTIINEIPIHATPLERRRCASRFKELTDDDLSTSSAFIIAVKPQTTQ